MRLSLSCLLLAASVVAQTAQPFSVATLETFNPPRKTWKIQQVRFAQDPDKGHIAIITGAPNTAVSGFSLTLGDWAPKFHTYDELRFDYKISHPDDWFGVKITDMPLAEGWQATWKLVVPHNADKQWQTASVNLHAPMYKWGESPVTKRELMFRYQHPHNQPLTIQLANIRLVRKFVTMELATPNMPFNWKDTRNGNVAIKLNNKADYPIQCNLTVASDIPQITVASKAKVTVPPKASITQRVPLAIAQDTRQLIPFTLTFNVTTDEHPDTPMDFLTLIGATPMKPIQTPSLMLTAQQVKDLKRRIKEVPRVAKWWENFKKSMDKWVAAKITYPPRGAQWWHWYSCKDCGSHLKTKTKTLHVCPTCKKEYTGYPYDDVVLSRDHDALARAIRDLGIAYLVTDDIKYATKAKEILLGYAERYLSYPLHDINGKPTKGGGHVHPQTLDEAIWLIYIVQGVDAIKSTLTKQELDFAAEKMLLPAAYHIKEHQWGIHNICCWHASAYGLTGLLLDKADLVQPAIFGPKGFMAQVNQGVTDDGQWYERAWGYHFYTTSALEPLAMAIYNTGIAELPPRFKLLFDGPIRFCSPTQELPAFHDSGRVKFIPRSVAGHYELAYLWWKDPAHGAIIAKTDRMNQMAALWGVEDVVTDAPGATSVNFEDTGVAILRSHHESGKRAAMPPNFIAMDYGEHGGGHGHPDKLNFVLWARRTLLAEDPGCIAYGNPAHQGWYRQTISHNTVLVDGASQKEATGKSLAWAQDDNATFVVADAGSIYPNFKAGRALALVGDTLLDILWAKDTKGNPRRIEYAFHSRGDIAFPDLGAPCEAPEGHGYKWGKNWNQQPHDGTWKATWLHESVRLSMAHASTAKGTLFNAKGQGNPPTVLFNLVLNQVQAKEAVYASAFAFSSKDAAEPTVQVQNIDLGAENAVGAKAVVGNNTFLFFVATDGQPTTFNYENCTYKGKAVLLKIVGGKPMQILAD